MPNVNAVENRNPQRVVGTPSPASAQPQSSTPQPAKPTGYSTQDQFSPTRPRSYALIQTDSSGGSASPPGHEGASPLDPNAKAKADADYDRHVNPQTSGNEEATRTGWLVELLKEHSGDGSYTTELIARAKADGTLNAAVDGPGGIFVRGQGADGKLTGPYLRGSNDERAAVIDALNTAESLGYLSRSDIYDRGATEVSGWHDVSQAMGITSKPPASVAKDKLAALQQAQHDAETTDKKLADELSRFGGGMTSAQKDAYIKAFKAKNKDVYAKVETAAKDLADYVKANQSDIFHDAAVDPAGAQALRDELKALSTTAQAGFVHDTVVSVFGDADGALAKQLKGACPDFANEVILPAEQTLQGLSLTQHGGDVMAAFNDFKTRYGQLMKLKGFAGSFNDVSVKFQQLNQYMDSLQKGAQVPQQELKSWLKSFDSTPGGKLLSRFGLLMTMTSCVTDAQKGDFRALVGDIAATVKGGTPLVTDAIKSLTSAGWYSQLAATNPELAQLGEGALKFADFAKRFAPVLGAVVNGVDIAKRLASKDFNAGDAVAIVGDAIGLLGQAVEFAPEVAAPIQAIGAGLTAGGSLLHDAISGYQKEQEIKADAADLMKKAGIQGKQYDVLLGSSPLCMENLARMGLTGDQVSQLIDEGDLFNTPIQDLPKLAKDFQMSGEGMFRLLKGLGSGGGDRNKALGRLLEALAHHGEVTNEDTWIHQIEVEASSIQSSDPASAKALRDVIAQLKAQKQSNQERRDWNY